MKKLHKVRRSYTQIPRLHFRAVILLSLFLSQVLPVFCGDAQATIYWSNKDGTADGFDWKNGGSDNGLFGDPTLVGGSTFVFFPSNFRAESVNGQSAVVSDRLQFEIIAQPGKEIQGIRITEYGDYGILTEGSVSVTGTMFLTNLSSFGVYYDELATDPASPITSGQGTWTGEVSVTDINWTHLQIVLDNNLLAISLPGSTAFIEKKIVGSGIDIEIIVPEPATIAMLAIGSVLFVPRKKHS